MHRDWSPLCVCPVESHSQLGRGAGVRFSQVTSLKRVCRDSDAPCAMR